MVQKEMIKRRHACLKNRFLASRSPIQVLVWTKQEHNLMRES